MRAAACAVVAAVVSFGGGVAEAGPGEAQFVSARRADRLNKYIQGALSYEVEIKNTASSPLRTNLIVEAPTGQTPTEKRDLVKVPVDIPARSSKFIKFEHGQGFTPSGCYTMMFYVRLENDAAPAKTIHVNANCKFVFAQDRAFSAPAPGKVSVSGLDLKRTFTCEQGLAMDLTIKNDTKTPQKISYAIGEPKDVAVSPETTVAAGHSAKLKLGWFLKAFGGYSQKMQLEIRGPAKTDIAQPPGFQLKRSCEPIVTLKDANQPYDVEQFKKDNIPEIGFAIVSAYYGRNCNIAIAKSDISRDVTAKCKTARGTCNYSMTWAPWGGRDPNPSLCKKEIDIAYQCGWSGPVKTVKVLHEKTPQTVPLSCQ